MRLEIIVFIKFCGVRDLGKLRAFLPLGLDKVGKKLLGEYAACGEVVMIRFEGVERFGQGCGRW